MTTAEMKRTDAELRAMSTTQLEEHLEVVAGEPKRNAVRIEGRWGDEDAMRELLIKEIKHAIGVREVHDSIE